MPRAGAERYPIGMVRPATSRAIRMALGLVCALTMIAPAQAERQTRARLVSCGENSCLRLSGYRARGDMVVRIGEHDLSVEGDRAWQATVPLDVARAWPIARNYAVRVTLVDPDAGTERVETVMLPPGALGSRTEIASLIISAR
jgi:hypothetical protein